MSDKIPISALVPEHPRPLSERLSLKYSIHKASELEWQRQNPYGKIYIMRKGLRNEKKNNSCNNSCRIR